MVGIRDGENSALAESIRGRANKFQKFSVETVDLIKKEYYLVREKLDNLSETNYQQGLKYLEKGDIHDAIFRFRIVIRFWPDQYPDAYYQLAYALILNNKVDKAKSVLEHLVKAHPDYSNKAKELFDRINKSSSDAA